MKKICLIGDSHAAAMMYPWRERAGEFPDIDITPFTSHRDRFVHLTVAGNALVPQDEELRMVLKRGCKFEPVIAGDYDRYILCGLGFALLPVMLELKDFRSSDQTADRRTPVSRAVYLRAMTDCLRESVCMQVARKVRAITQRPMTIVPAPRLSDAKENGMYRKFRENGDAEKIAGYFLSASDILAKELDANVAHQPPQSLRDPLQTLAIYEQVSPRKPRPDRPPEARDYQHMNDEFGRLVLRDLFAPG